jgi:hypothetical protein
MDIFQKVRELNLPDNTYVVVGGGLLVALGLLDWDDDVDLCVSTELFEKLKTQGWHLTDWRGRPILKRDVYDIGVGFGEWSLAELQSDAMIIKGIPFISPTKLLSWKKQMARPKDLQHIELFKKIL